MSSGGEGAFVGTSDGLDGDTLGATDSPGRSREDLGFVRGATVGRYVVLGPLGAGGMSIVYAAYDPELDRKIALKLLRPNTRSSHAQDDRARLIREAQAMARLSHANVVSVYDVGTTGVGDSLFLAMQFVDGMTLKEWLASPRSWRQIVGAFVQAGRGLDAAHSVGLVHRDFKPDNVLVDDAGVARVTDFGLARDAVGLSVSDSGNVAGPDLAPEESQAALIAVTAAGIVLGTPAYMAPEQHERSPLDARSDQFSFCVALWEALFGERPFGGRTIAEVSYEVTQGNLRAAPRESPVPARVRRALVRGLSRDPELRYPNMAALLAELDDHGRERRPVWIAGAVALVGAGAVLAYLAMGGASDRCDRGRERLAGVWDEARRTELGAAFAALSRADASEVGRRVDAGLTEYARGWVDATTAACEATLVQGVQSDEALDLRMQCFDRSLGELGALVDVFAGADAVALDHAVDAVAALTPISQCDDIERLRQRSPLPQDPGERRSIDELQREVDRLRALIAIGALERSGIGVDDLVRRVEATGFLPLVAQVKGEAALVHRVTGDPAGAEQLAFAGARAAEVARDDLLAARAWLDVLDMVSSSGARTPEVRVLAEVAAAAISRAGDQPGQRAHYELLLGTHEQATGNRAGARVHFETALDVLDRSEVPDDGSRSAVLNNLGVSLLGDGEFLQARAMFQQALVLSRAAYGEHHAAVAEQLANLATTFVIRGEYTEADPHVERAIEIVTALGGADAPQQGVLYVVRSQVSLGMGKLEYARRDAEHALAIFERTAGTEHPAVAAVLNNLGRVAYAMGRFDISRAEQERALALLSKLLGTEHPDLAAPMSDIARIDLRMGELERACHGYARALALAEAGNGPDHYSLQDALAGLGACELERGRPAEAIASLERALAIRQRAGCDAGDLAFTQLTLARALWAAGRERKRARELAEGARELWSAPHQADDRAAATAWLAQTR